MAADGSAAPRSAGSNPLRIGGAALCLAALVGALVLSLWVAVKNFAIADPAKSPETARVLEMAHIEGEQSREMFSRYFASESNRALFTFLGPFQVVAALLAFALAFGPAKGARHGKTTRALLAVVAVAAIAMAPLVPMMIEKGRAIDFVPRAPETPDRAAFMRWHGLYMAGDVVLLLGSLALLPLLVGAATRPVSAPPPAPGRE